MNLVATKYKPFELGFDHFFKYDKIAWWIVHCIYCIIFFFLQLWYFYLKCLLLKFKNFLLSNVKKSTTQLSRMNEWELLTSRYLPISYHTFYVSCTTRNQFVSRPSRTPSTTKILMLVATKITISFNLLSYSLFTVRDSKAVCVTPITDSTGILFISLRLRSGSTKHSTFEFLFIRLLICSKISDPILSFLFLLTKNV